MRTMTPIVTVGELKAHIAPCDDDSKVFLLSEYGEGEPISIKGVFKSKNSKEVWIFMQEDEIYVDDSPSEEDEVVTNPFMLEIQNPEVLADTPVVEGDVVQARGKMRSA